MGSYHRSNKTSSRGRGGLKRSVRTSAQQGRDCRVARRGGLLAMTRCANPGAKTEGNNALSYAVIASDRRERGNLTCDFAGGTDGFETKH